MEVLLKENDSLRRIAGIDPVAIGLELTRLMFSVSRNGSSLRSFNFGEPHIVDFNDKYFFQSSVGEFVLAKSAGSTFEVQARFEKINESASFITAATMLVSGDTVALYPNEKPDSKDYTALRVNGAPVIMVNSVHYLPMGGLIIYENKQYSVQWPNGETVIMEIKPYKNKKFMNIAIQVPSDDPDDYEGLSNSGNETAKNRITMDQSLFIYNDQKGFEYFAGLKDENVNRPELSDQEKEKARNTCLDAGVNSSDLKGCIYDLGHFGIAPNPRPEFIFPTDDITLVKLEYEKEYTNESLANNQLNSEPTVFREQNRTSMDPSQRQELFRTIFRIALSAAENSSFGSGPIGR